MLTQNATVRRIHYRHTSHVVSTQRLVRAEVCRWITSVHRVVITSYTVERWLTLCYLISASHWRRLPHHHHVRSRLISTHRRRLPHHHHVRSRLISTHRRRLPHHHHVRSRLISTHRNPVPCSPNGMVHLITHNMNPCAPGLTRHLRTTAYEWHRVRVAPRASGTACECPSQAPRSPPISAEAAA